MSVLIKAQAKVNLGLSVTAKRADGFHEIDTLFVRLELHDRLRLEPLASGIELELINTDLPTDAKNLAFRAAEAYLRAGDESRGVRLVLEKQIPIAAGLGGGSSDAAAVLRGLAKLYPAELDLMALAANLGSDVSFFVQNITAARAQGRGELLKPVDLPTLYLVLVNPGIAVSAADAYANLQSFSPGLELDLLLKQLRSGEQPSYVNDLQAGVTKLEPVINNVSTVLNEAGLNGVLMSGSGSTCFGLATDEAAAKLAAAKLSRLYPQWWIKATKTC